MVEIVRRGLPPGEIVHDVTCHTCRSELRFLEAEAKVIGNYQMAKVYLEVTCPVCGAKCGVEK